MPSELDKIEKQLEENFHSLHISRVPIDTKRKFKELAKTEFCEDFGMTLKFLMDGLIDIDNQEIMMKLDDLNRRVFNLENKKPDEKKRAIKMCDGSRIEVDET